MERTRATENTIVSDCTVARTLVILIRDEVVKGRQDLWVATATQGLPSIVDVIPFPTGRCAMAQDSDIPHSRAVRSVSQWLPPVKGRPLNLGSTGRIM